MQENNYDLQIVHFENFDFIGHNFGTNDSPLTADAIQQYNDYIEKIT